MPAIAQTVQSYSSRLRRNLLLSRVDARHVALARAAALAAALRLVAHRTVLPRGVRPREAGQHHKIPPWVEEPEEEHL